MTDRPNEPLQFDRGFAELLERLNTQWRIVGPAPTASFKQRLAYRVRQVLARLLGPQETFNASVVQSINTLSTTQGAVLEALVALDEVERHREALAARERRMEAAMERMRAEHDELRTSMGVLRQATNDLTRQSTRTTEAPAPTSTHVLDSNRTASPSMPSSSSVALSHKYVGFEDQFRGTVEDIRARLADYLQIFSGASDVLDIGCGRGEFLESLGAQGVPARGIDVNDSMIEVCREKGLDATQADALSYLRAQPASSLGGLFAAQVVEHLEPAYLTELLDAAFTALKPGASIVLETINPACWFAFFESYVRDITHVRPLHPDTLTFLLVATGFQDVEVRYRVPYPEHEKLQSIPPAAVLGDSVETLNANVDKINRLLFTYLDYAAIGRKALPS